eukprot:363740-Chlamydomonas_euryale.AAC.8
MRHSSWSCVFAPRRLGAASPSFAASLCRGHVHASSHQGSAAVRELLGAFRGAAPAAAPRLRAVQQTWAHATAPGQHQKRSPASWACLLLRLRAGWHWRWEARVARPRRWRRHAAPLPTFHAH